jgi:hypothetical protein
MSPRLYLQIRPSICSCFNTTLLEIARAKFLCISFHSQLAPTSESPWIGRDRAIAELTTSNLNKREQPEYKRVLA